MATKWSDIKGKTFEKRWQWIRHRCEKARGICPYGVLHKAILNDPDAFKFDSGSMPPEHAAGPDAKEYELVILLAAQYFTTARPTGRGLPTDRRRFDTFDEAVADAGTDKRVLIYGVCETGRAAVLSRELWKAYSTIVAAVSERDSRSIIDGASKKYSKAMKRLADR